MPIAGVTAIGFFGFVLRVRVLWTGFWKTFLPLLIGWNILHTLILGHLLGIAQLNLGGDDRVGFTVWVLPMYLALFLYGYRSARFWTDPAHPGLLAVLGVRPITKARMFGTAMLTATGGIALGVATFFDLTMPWLIVMLVGGSAVVLAVLYRTTPEFFAPGFTDDGAKGVMRLAISMGAVGVTSMGAVGVTIGGLSYIHINYGLLPSRRSRETPS